MSEHPSTVAPSSALLSSRLPATTLSENGDGQQAFTNNFGDLLGIIRLQALKCGVRSGTYPMLQAELCPCQYEKFESCILYTCIQVYRVDYAILYYPRLDGFKVCCIITLPCCCATKVPWKLFPFSSVQFLFIFVASCYLLDLELQRMCNWHINLFRRKAFSLCLRALLYYLRLLPPTCCDM